MKISNVSETQRSVEDTRIQCIHLLWTGGWDSTFRLLQLILIEEKSVQPHYIIDENRASCWKEIESMRSIKMELERRFPSAKEKLLPTKYINIAHIVPDQEITNAQQRIQLELKIDPQYEWLARYCKQKGIDRMEICIIQYGRHYKNDTFVGKIKQMKSLRDLPEEESLFADLKLLFLYFELPLLDARKKDLLELATQYNWMGMMDKTWFCYYPLYHPLKGKVPCGSCVTCRSQYKHHFEWRIPLYSKIIQKTRKFKNTVTAFFI